MLNSCVGARAISYSYDINGFYAKSPIIIAFEGTASLNSHSKFFSIFLVKKIFETISL